MTMAALIVLSTSQELVNDKGRYHSLAWLVLEFDQYCHGIQCCAATKYIEILPLAVNVEIEPHQERLMGGGSAQNQEFGQQEASAEHLR